MRDTKALYGILFVSIIFALVYLFLSTSSIQKTINQNIENILINEAKSFAQNIDKKLHEKLDKNPYEELANNPQLRTQLNDKLSLLINPTLKYIFVLYKDKHNTYRYLLDGSFEGEFHQRLAVEKKYWDKVYSTKKAVLIKQNQLENIWITCLQPVIFDQQVKAVIAIDFSTQLPKNIYYAIDPLKKIFTYIFIAIIILILILVYQTLLSFKNKKASITDELTQVYNRNFLRELLKDINIAEYQIIMLDIDYFKHINDNYGHKAGDLILTQTAQIIKECVRHEDYLIRFGGEEFLIFTKKNNTNPKLAYDVAQRIRQTVEKHPFYYEDQKITITVSLGVAYDPEHFKSPSSAIKHADEMLYRAKREGRNLVIANDIAKDTKTQQVEKKTINEVKSALEENRIICYFQPIFDTQTQEILKYEALVRFVQKDGSILAPYFFLSSVTHTSVYNDLTKRVLEIVFDKIKEKKCTMSLNLNFSDILDNTIYKMILEQLQMHKDLAQWLVIELLEYELIEDGVIIKEKLENIRAFGVKIAIDDFGSGYSNYSIFKVLPIDILKIDGSLIKDIDTSKISYTLTHSIVTLAQELNITTVAEFVHSKEVFEVVQKLNVDETQGYFLSEPLATI
jgi:diguanylate cyclase (GGDEF)-like protein